MHELLQLATDRKLLLGMVHLPPLPGSPGAGSSPPGETIEAALECARRDAAAILDGGMDGLIVENFGDTPFHPDRVPPITIAAMCRVTAKLADEFGDRGLLGVNVLRNDAAAAIAIATAAGLDLIRVNVHCGAMVTDQGILEGRAHETLRERSRLSSTVAILADVLVKHAAPLGERDPGDLARETAGRGMADGLIVTGSATGSTANIAILEQVRAAVRDRPILLGSGVRAATVGEYLALADGLIVGTALKEHDNVHAPVDAERVRRLVDAARAVAP